MVTRGQLLERPVVIPDGERCLDGIYLRGGATALLIASPLPTQGGSMANPVGNELAYAAAYAGCASLRLDYRGVGASEGEASARLGDHVADLALGVDFLLESAGGEGVAVAGYDSGSWAALALGQVDDRVDRLLLVCPPERPADAPDFADVVKPTLVVLPADDPHTQRAEWEARREQAKHLRVHLVRSETRALRQGLVELARMVPMLLGAPPKE